MARPAHGDGPLGPTRRRNAELLLLLIALSIFVLGLAVAGLQIDGRLPNDLSRFAGVFIGSALVLHLALRFLAPAADPVAMPVAVALNGVGLTVIWGLHRVQDTDSAEAEKQLVWAAAGMALCLAVLIAVQQVRRLQRYPYLMAAAGLVLLLLPMFPVIGIEVFGARRWIGVGGFTVQPSEFAKILLIIFLAGYLGAKRDVLSLAARQLRIGPVTVFSQPRMRDLGPITAGWGIAILLLVGTKDLGTSLLLFSVFLAILYTATRRKSWVVIGLVMFFVGAVAAWAVFWHVRQRVTIWLHAFDPDVYRAENGGSYQLVQGLFALADGGMSGTGFGSGRTAGIFASDSDLILITIGEKFGLAGLLAVLLLLLLLAERGFRIALDSRDVFVKLMATGFAFLFAFQVFIVLGGVTRIIPLTGMTTPFLAAGGSSLMSSWIMVGLWLRMSDNTRRPAPQKQPGDGATRVIRLCGDVTPSIHATARA